MATLRERLRKNRAKFFSWLFKANVFLKRTKGCVISRTARNRKQQSWENHIRRLQDEENQRVRHEQDQRTRAAENLRIVNEELRTVLRWDDADHNDEHAIVEGTSINDMPDELQKHIFTLILQTSPSPVEYMNMRLSCKTMNRVGVDAQILRSLTQTLLANPLQWEDKTDRFLQQCAAANNDDAVFFLGMIYFYCQNRRYQGHVYLKKAAGEGHMQAQFEWGMLNLYRRGRTFKRNLRTGFFHVRLAADKGHILAKLELAHCLKEGVGVHENNVKAQEIMNNINLNEGEMYNTLIQKFIVAWRTPNQKRCRICSLPELSDANPFDRCLCGALYCSYACRTFEKLTNPTHRCARQT